MTTLVISMAPFIHAPRSRKAARSYRRNGDQVVFFSLQTVGRTGKWDRNGHRVIDGVHVRQVKTGTPIGEPSFRAQMHNLLIVYLPALLRLALGVLSTPADVVHVGGTPLLALGKLHKRLFSSTLVLDVEERPGSVGARGSLFSWFARAERRSLRRARNSVDLTCSVAPGHAEILERTYGHRHVLVLRNAPATSWIAPFAPPASSGNSPFRVVTIGTIFEGRAFELMIDAIHRLNDLEETVELNVYGGGRPEYLRSLEERAAKTPTRHRIQFHGPIEPEAVSATYLQSDLGLALYETEDAGNDSLSNKIIECVASGRPVLAGDLPENRRFVEHFQTGWLCTVDSDSIAESLRQILKERETIRSLSEHCRRLGEVQLNWEAGFDQVRRELATLQRPQAS